MKNGSDRYTKVEYNFIRILQLVCLFMLGLRILAEEISSGNSWWIHLLEIIRRGHLCC